MPGSESSYPKKPEGRKNLIGFRFHIFRASENNQGNAGPLSSDGYSIINYHSNLSGLCGYGRLKFLTCWRTMRDPVAPPDGTDGVLLMGRDRLFAQEAKICALSSDRSAKTRLLAHTLVYALEIDPSKSGWSCRPS